jgi:hypothetical protein
MRPHTAACLTALALLAAPGCAGSGRGNDGTGAAPLDTIHIKSGDTLAPANGVGAMRRDTATSDSAGRAVPGMAQQDSTSGLSGAGAIDTTPLDSAQRSRADSVP